MTTGTLQKDSSPHLVFIGQVYANLLTKGIIIDVEKCHGSVAMMEKLLPELNLLAAADAVQQLALLPWNMLLWLAALCIMWSRNRLFSPGLRTLDDVKHSSNQIKHPQFTLCAWTC